MLSTLLRRKFGTFSTRTLKGHVVEKLGIKNKTILRNLRLILKEKKKNCLI